MANHLKVSVKVEGVADVRRSLTGMTAGLAKTLHLTAGNLTANLIRENAAAGKGIDGQLSPYRSSGRKASGALRVKGETPNLTDTGRMLSDVRYDARGRAVAIKGKRAQIAEYIQHAQGNNPSGRKFFGVGKRDQPKLDKAIKAEADKIVRDNRGKGYVTEGAPTVTVGKVAVITNP